MRREDMATPGVEMAEAQTHGRLLKDETAFRTKVRKTFLDMPKSTAKTLPGTMQAEGLPDIAYCTEGVSGFLELKFVRHWPKRKTTIQVRVTPAQQLWLRQWADSSGNANVLLLVEYQWFILPPPEKPFPTYEVKTLSRYVALGLAGTLDHLERLPSMLRELHAPARDIHGWD
jgi:hypothetical protein